MRVLLTVLWISVAVGPIANDFNATHLFNPDWPPHARLHMMTVFTSAVAIALYGLFATWGPTLSRLQSLRQSTLLGLLYVFGLCVAATSIPLYGGSMYSDDVEPRAATLADENYIVFISITIVFAVAAAILFFRKLEGPRAR